MKKITCLTLCCLLLGSLASAALAAYPKMNIQLSHNQPVDSPEDVGAQKFKEVVEAKSDGAITVSVFPQMQLGSMREQTEMVQMGTLEMSIQPTAVLTPFVEQFQVIDFPFLWADSSELYRIMDGPVGQKFYAFSEEKGLKTLGLWASGFKQLTTKGRQINTPDDIKGLKIRVMPSPMLVKQYESWGANPVPVEYAELYNALQQSIVDGQENPLQTIAMARLYEVQDYLTLSNHGFLGYLFIINKNWFDAQPDDVKALIIEAEQTARDAERASQAENEGKFLEQIKASKITVNELSPEVRADFSKRCLTLHAELAATDDMKALLDAVYQAK